MRNNSVKHTLLIKHFGISIPSLNAAPSSVLLSTTISLNSALLHILIKLTNLGKFKLECLEQF